MALHASLGINGTQIGLLVAQRLSPQHPADDDVCRYDWTLIVGNSRVSGSAPLEHRYGDGAWALVAKVIEASGLAAPATHGDEEQR